MLTLFSALCAVSSCRESEVVVEAPGVAVQGVSLSPQRLTLKVGDSRKLSFGVLPPGAKGASLSWKTGSRDIASIDTEGRVTANSAGTTTIYLKETGSGREAYCEVRVVAAYDSLIIPLAGSPVTCTKEKVIEYELFRGSVQDTVRSDDNYLFFKTRSRLFPQMVYVYDGRDFYVQAFSVPENPEVLRSGDFKAVVTACGFVPKHRSYLPGADNYTNGSYDLRIYPNARQVDIRWFPSQRGSIPSWKENPAIDLYPFLGNAGLDLQGGSMEEVAGFEKARGSVCSAFTPADAKSIATFEMGNGDIHRWYFYHGTPGAENFEGQAYHANLLWKDYTKAFRIEGRDVWMTEEFDDLLQMSGWSFRGSAGGYYWYGKPAVLRGLEVEMYFGVRAVRFSDFNQGEYSLQVQAYVAGPPD